MIRTYNYKIGNEIRASDANKHGYIPAQHTAEQPIYISMYLYLQKHANIIPLYHTYMKVTYIVIYAIE